MRPDEDHKANETENMLQKIEANDDQAVHDFNLHIVQDFTWTAPAAA
jgi:hypothetical protein